MPDAIVVTSGLGLDRPDLLARPIGGVPLLLRTLLSLQRAGCRNIFVVYDAATGDSGILDPIRTDRRLVAEVTWLGADGVEAIAALAEEADERVYIRVAANRVFDFRVVRDLPEPAEGEVVSPGVGEGGIHACGAGLLKALGPAAWRQEGWEALLDELADCGAVREVEADQYLIAVRTTEDFAEAERQVFASLGDNEGGLEGFLDHHVTRRFSIHLTRLLAPTPLTPNQITFVSFAIGLASLYVFSLPGYWNKILGALLLAIATIVDHTDGEIARLKFQTSPFGAKLDMWLDQVLYTFLMLAVGIGVAKDLGDAVYVWLGAACAFGSFMGCLYTSINQFFGSQAPAMAALQPGETPAEPQSLFSRMIHTFGTRDFGYYLLLVAILDLLHCLLWVFAFGVQAFWIILTLLYFFGHRGTRASHP